MLINNTNFQKKLLTLLVDDHLLFLDGLKSILEPHESLQLLPSVTRANEALEIILNSKVDFIITDINLPDMSGIDLVKNIKKKKPEIPVLVLSMYCDRKDVKNILLSEAEGYLLKIAGKQELFRAIDKIIHGGTYYSSEITSIMMEIINNRSCYKLNYYELTTRELEILDLICKECSNKEISEKLSISISTIETHRNNMFQKTGSKNVVGLVRYAVENKLVSW
jgi:DNA-binding NarL/FixJ family response regulator